MGDYELVRACEDLIARARSAPAATTQIELLAYLSLATADMRHLNVELERQRAAVPVRETPMQVTRVDVPAAPKCRHEFLTSVLSDGREVTVCVKCNAPKKANGRPRAAAPAAPAAPVALEVKS